MHHIVALQAKISDLESRLLHSERLMSEQRSAFEKQANESVRELEVSYPVAAKTLVVSPSTICELCMIS